MTDLHSPENQKSSLPPSLPGKAPRVPLPLKIAVIGMGAALVVMFVLVASRFMEQRAKRAASPAATGIAWAIDLELAGTVKSAVLDGRILTVVIEGSAGGDRVVLVDTRKGRIIGKVQLVSP